MRFRARKPHVPNFSVLARTLATTARAVALDKIKAFAEAQRKRFQQAIFAQKFPAFHAHPLADSTIDKKATYDRDLRVMVSTQEYVKSIRVFVRTNHGGRGVLVYVGHAPNKKARDTVTGKVRSEVTMRMVARIHEFGAPAAHIPARPHWGPHLKQMRRQSPKVRAAIMRLAVAKVRRSIGER